MTHCFKIEFGQDEVLTVFAESVNQAADMFITWRMLNGHEEPESFAIAKGFRDVTDQRQREHMRVAMLRREIGVATYDAEEGYRVVPVIDAGLEGTGAPWDDLGQT
jgi:hypothetical protein